MWAIEQTASLDWETYSEAGFDWDTTAQKWVKPKGSSKEKGLAAVGACAYAEHPTTEIFTASYKLPSYDRPRRWKPGDPLPQDLFDYVARGGLVKAHNSMFEYAIWIFVACRKYGWPPIALNQMRCSMAQAHVNNLPGGLEALADVVGADRKKNPEGKRLIKKFSVPQNPTKKNPALRIHRHDDPVDALLFDHYCDDDVEAEQSACAKVMPLSVDELRFWKIDQQMNWRGLGVDMPSVRNMIAVLEEAQARYGVEMAELTGGLRPSQNVALANWVRARGVPIAGMKEEAIDEVMDSGLPLPDDVRRVLEIRRLVGSASVKKLYAIARSTNSDDRVRNSIIHHKTRTGRPGGELLQPLNLPKSGPDLAYCGCGKPHARADRCPWCGCPVPPGVKRYKWPDVPRGYSDNPVDHVQEIMATRSLDAVEYVFGDALLAISGCVRGMIVAGPGHDLIASDYSAIEAVVTAALSGCEWRMQAFRERKDIYLVSCSTMPGGLTYDEYMAYFEANNRSHHPHRQKKGKVAELALGFGGWIGAWKQFDTNDTPEDEIKSTILAWRDASPEIVEMWGGQQRGRGRDKRLERFGFEGAFVNAVQYPGQMFTSNGVSFYMRGDALIIRLLSGRELTYHSPRLWPSTREYDLPGVMKITYMTWNSNPKYGPTGWVPMETYAGRIAENIVQATAHDIQRFGIEALEAAGYPVVLHVYDENVAEVPQGWGSIEEFEAIMSTMPPWAAGWPVRASGGWRGRRYRKG